MSHPWIYKSQLSSLITPGRSIFHFHINSNRVVRTIELSKLNFSSIEINKWLPTRPAKITRYLDKRYWGKCPEYPKMINCFFCDWICILHSFVSFFFFWLGRRSCVTTKTKILRSVLATYKASCAMVIVFGAEKLMVTSELKILKFSNIIHICDVIGPKYSPNWPQISLITP